MSAAYSQMNNLYSEDDLLRNAAGKNFSAKGFDRKAYNKIFNEKPGSNFSDSVTGHAIPAGYYNLDDSFSGGGAMPPPGGNYFQTGQTGQSSQQQTAQKPYYEGFLAGMIKGAKKGLYQGITEFPVFVRDGVVRWLSKKSWFLDLSTSLYQMGADVGPVQRMRTDFLDDTLELIVNGSSELLALRIYNDKKYTPFVNWILEGDPIPYHGKPAEKDDVNYTPGGLIVYKKTCGGEPLMYTGLSSDQAYHALGTLKWVTHGEVLKTGLDTSQLWKNLNEFTISYYINDRKDLWVPLQKHTETGEQIYRITLPKGWNPKNWDYRLMKKTAYYSVGGAALLHVPFWVGEKMYGFLGLEPSLIEGRELSAMFIPDKRLITRGM